MMRDKYGRWISFRPLISLGGLDPLVVRRLGAAEERGGGACQRRAAYFAARPQKGASEIRRNIRGTHVDYGDERRPGTQLSPQPYKRFDARNASVWPAADTVRYVHCYCLRVFREL